MNLVKGMLRSCEVCNRFTHPKRCLSNANNQQNFIYDVAVGNPHPFITATNLLSPNLDGELEQESVG